MKNFEKEREREREKNESESSDVVEWSGMERRGVKWSSGVEWSGVEWSGVE
jgi:hypothetical protein